MKIKDGFILKDVAGSKIVIATGDAKLTFNGVITFNSVGAGSMTYSADIDYKVLTRTTQQFTDRPIIIGGEMQDTTYGDYQKEMDIFNKAFCEVMLEGDSKGRVFTFPVPTINVTKEFDWDSDVVNSIMDITCKYGIPYFANYVNSDLSPE